MPHASYADASTEIFVPAKHGMCSQYERWVPGIFRQEFHMVGSGVELDSVSYPLFGGNAGDLNVAWGFQGKAWLATLFGRGHIASPVFAVVVPEGGDVVEFQEQGWTWIGDPMLIDLRLEFQISRTAKGNIGLDVAIVIEMSGYAHFQASILQSIRASSVFGMELPGGQPLGPFEISLPYQPFRAKSRQYNACQD